MDQAITNWPTSGFEPRMQQRLQWEAPGIEPRMSTFADSKMNFHVEQVGKNERWPARPNGQWIDQLNGWWTDSPFLEFEIHVPFRMDQQDQCSVHQIHVPFQWIHVLVTRSMFRFNGSMFCSSFSTDPCSMHSTITSKKHREIKPHAFNTSFLFPSEK